MPQSSESAHLVLADGTVLTGRAFGARGSALGEVVFNTGMTGYQEVLTDPSYAGQMVTFTYPELGNTGVNPDDQEADTPHAKGVIARQLAPCPSNWRCQNRLSSGWNATASLESPEWIPVPWCVISEKRSHERGDQQRRPVAPGPPGRRAIRSQHGGLNLAREVSTREAYQWNAACSVGFDQRLRTRSSQVFNVVAVDFGIKRAILDRLVAHGCQVTVVPADSGVEDVLKHQPDGVFLSNGRVTLQLSQVVSLWPSNFFNTRIYRSSAYASATRFSVWHWGDGPSSSPMAIAV